ncbi:MAG: alginate export family protein [bacterium]|nr:alginate export family protein [bacterium]
MIKCFRIFVLCTVLGVGQVWAGEVEFGGQVRPRFEFRDQASGPHDLFTSMRVRAQVKAALERDVQVLIQLQDVRLWGEEGNTLGDFRADNFDLHQGYAELSRLGGAPVSIRAGRQEISLGGQRLVGAVGWTQQGRALDGMRVTIAPKGGSLDLLGIRLLDSSAAGISENGYLFGAYGQIKRYSSGVLDLYVLYNRISGGADTDQSTLGGRWAGQRNLLKYRLEGTYQTGTRSGQDVAAYMLGARVGMGTAGGKTQVTLWYDYLSGDEDQTDRKTRVFDTLFATNHKFYGFADLFLNIPVHTGGLGLQDVALKVEHSPRKNVSLLADAHLFLLAEKGGLASGRLAEEVDLTLRYKYSANVTLVGGVSYVIAEDAIKAIGRLSDHLGWGYVMMDVAF